MSSSYHASSSIFQPTLPARGATRRRCARGASWSNFNPRSPHGERPSGRHPCGHPAISTHAPRTGSDALTRWIAHAIAYFNPRSPHGERHNPPDDDLPAEVISTHAPRTGSDPSFRRVARLDLDFNPRSPHGERPETGDVAGRGKPHFNPRSPHGERPGVRPS